MPEQPPYPVPGQVSGRGPEYDPGHPPVPSAPLPPGEPQWGNPYLGHGGSPHGSAAPNGADGRVNPYTGQGPSQRPSSANSPEGGRGWRRVFARGSRGSGLEQQRLIRLQAPVPRPYRLSVTSIKGGVGKTTTSAMLGLTFARYRADRTVVMDANPHAGTLAERLLGERVMPTLRDLVNAEMRSRAARGQGLPEPSQIHQYLGQVDRLMVAASEQDSDVSEAFGELQYSTAQEVLKRVFDLIITDSGTGMKHSAMRGTLEATDRLLVVAAPRFDAARRAAKTLDEVYARGYAHLVRDAVVVITMDTPKAVGIDLDTLVDYFQQLCTSVIKVPYDQHLYMGGTIDYDEVSPATRGAYMDLAAVLADGFGHLLPGR